MLLGTIVVGATYVLMTLHDGGLYDVNLNVCPMTNPALSVAWLSKLAACDRLQLCRSPTQVYSKSVLQMNAADAQGRHEDQGDAGLGRVNWEWGSFLGSSWKYKFQQCRVGFYCGHHRFMENPRTALHIAAANDDVDGVCRLIEWGADVNIRDNKKYAPYLYLNLSSCIKEPVRLDCCLW